MRVCADRQHARPHEAELRQDDVLDADAALLEVVDDALRLCEIAHDLREACALDVLRRLEMIRHERNLRVVKDLAADLVELRNRRRRRDVVRKHHVELARDELACVHLREAGVPGENLLAHIHAHEICPPYKESLPKWEGFQPSVFYFTRFPRVLHQNQKVRSFLSRNHGII